MEDEYHCAVPLDDIVLIDRFGIEADMETFDIDTKILDFPDSSEYMTAQIIDDSVNDIVLDSDEEGTEAVCCAPFLKETKTSDKLMFNTLVYRRRQGKNISGYSVQSLASAKRTNTVKHGYVEKDAPASFGASEREISELEDEVSHGANKIVDKGNESLKCSKKIMRRNLAVDIDTEKLGSSHCEIKHGKKDVPTLTCHGEFERVSNTDFQKPGEPSHLEVLDFVDHFLSCNNLDILEKIDGQKVDLIKSTPTFSAKGAQTLARRASLAAKDRSSAIFEWDEKQITEGNSVKLLGEDFDVGSSGQPPEKSVSETYIPDTFDVGFDTQMAAEAMEALIYAPSPNTQAEYTRQVPKSEIHTSSEAATGGNESKICVNLKMPASVSQINRKKSEKKKTTATKLNDNMSCPYNMHSGNLKEYNLPSAFKIGAISRKPLGAKSLNCKQPRSMKKNIHGRNSRLISQENEDGTSERENLKGASDKEDTIVMKFRKISNNTKRTECKPSERSSKISKDPVSCFKRSMSNNLEFKVYKRRRKTSSVETDICKTFERKILNFNCDALAEIMNSKCNQQGISRSGLFGTGIPMKLDPWCYAKKKRTHKGVPRHSKGFRNSSVLLTVADDENGNKYPPQNIKSLKPMGGPLLFRQTKCQTFLKKRPSVNASSKQKAKERSLPGVYKCGSVITSEQMLQVDLDRAALSNVSGKSNIKLDTVSGDSKASQTSKSNKDFKVPCKKILSSSSLINEITRLGCSKSLPNFLPRELRKCRKEKVSVLFSQHLESKILYHQKKILARLGFSVASCCSDATHFVTDRFVRTRNMLEAIAFGKPVVTHSWLESCGQANCVIDEKCYILRDAKKEKEIGFSMPVSLACASQHPLMMGRRVFITPNVKPGIEVVESLVKAVHGKAVKRIPKADQNDDLVPRDLLILSSKEDYATCVPLLEKGAEIYDSELLLNGIVIQKLEYERHQLFTNYVGSNCYRKRPRK